MKKKLTFPTVLFLGFLVQGLAAQEISRVGTASGQFLKLGIGARAAALGEAAVAMPGEISGLYWNPSGIASIQRPMLMVSRVNLYADITHNFLGFVLPLGGSSALGVSALYLDSGDIEITTIENPNGTGTFYDVKDMAVGFSYARFITNRLQLGATIKFVQEGIWREKARTLAVDLGSVLDTGLLGLKLGMALTNFGGNMTLQGPELRASLDRYPQNPGEPSVPANLDTDDWPLPLSYRIGLSTQLIGSDGQLGTSEKNRLVVAFDAVDTNDALLRGHAGIEYTWNDILSLRGGYRGFVMAKDQYDTYETNSYTFGGGLHYDFGWSVLQLDYALSNFGRLENVHQFTVTLGF